MSVLIKAVASNDLTAVIKAMMKGDYKINDVDKEGRTALHHACIGENRTLIKYLLGRKEIDTTITDRYGKTALESVDPASRNSISLLFSEAMTQKQMRSQRVSSAQNKKLKESEAILEEDTRESDVVSPATLRKVTICLLIPLLFLVYYIGVFFAIKFIALTFAFYMVSVAYFVAEVAIRPPWYHHVPHALELHARGCPDYWQGWINDPQTDFGLHYTDVSFDSTDRYTLRGWYVPPPEKCRRDIGVVLVHGGGRDRRSWERHLPFLHKAGYGCLLFDFREHGLSDGNMRGFTYGMRERFDVIAACCFMRKEYGYKRICAMGTSVGGSSVIMAGAIDKTIDVVIAENAITTSTALLNYQIISLIGGYFAHRPYSNLLFKMFRRLCTFWLNIRIGNKPDKRCQPLHCIQHISPRPILLMHGTVDTLVPYKHSQILFEAAKEPKELYLCEGAFHCGLFNTNPEEYEELVLRFLNKNSKLITEEDATRAVAE